MKYEDLLRHESTDMTCHRDSDPVWAISRRWLPALRTSETAWVSLYSSKATIAARSIRLSLQTTISGAPSSNGSSRRSRRHWISRHRRSEEHTSELQSLMRISYAVFCL